MTAPRSATTAACALPAHPQATLQAPFPALIQAPASVEAALLALASCPVASAATALDDALQAIEEQEALDLAGLLGCLDNTLPDADPVLDVPAVSAEQQPRVPEQQPLVPEQPHRRGCPARAAPPALADDQRGRRRRGSPRSCSSSIDSEAAVCDTGAARARVMALAKQVPVAKGETEDQLPEGGSDTGDQAGPDHKTAQERRRLKRRASNRESARRVRERRCQEVEVLEARHSALEARQQRLLSVLNALQAQKAIMAGQLQALHGQSAQAVAINAHLVGEVATLRHALAAHRSFDA